jgi:hypothetical protein
MKFSGSLLYPCCFRCVYFQEASAFQRCLAQMSRTDAMIMYFINNLNQLLKKLGLKLVLAATNEVIDFSGEGQTVQFLSTNMRGLMHEVYAWEVSEKQHLSIKYRRQLGKHIGNPPFGAARNKDGYLMPSPDGAWLLSNGLFVAGTPDNPPDPNAEWKSYYEAAKRVMILYVEKNRGSRALVTKMVSEAWPFEDKYGNPRPFKRDDIRRILNAWREYGGLGSNGRAKDIPAYEINLGEISFNEERAIFPIELLRKVVEKRVARAHRAPEHGVKKRDKVYLLRGPLVLFTLRTNGERTEQSTP